MKFATLFCLLLAVSAGAEEEGCSPERVVACVQALAMGTLEEGDTTDEEMCKEMRTATDCLRTEADACTAGMQDDEVEGIEKDLQDLEKLLKQNCEESGNKDDGDDDDAQVAMCLTENEDYIHECVGITGEDLISQVLQDDSLDHNFFKCSFYHKMTNCYVDRIREKCGQEAGDVAEVEFKDPESIAEACEGANHDNTYFSDALFQAFDKKKK